MAAPQKIKQNQHKIQSFHFWVYTTKNWKQSLKVILHTQIHSIIVHNSQKMEATQVSTGE